MTQTTQFNGVPPLLAVLVFWLAIAPETSRADSVAGAEGRREFQRGAFDEAIVFWQKDENASRRAGDTAGQITAEINLAAAYQALGQHRNAMEKLTDAVDLAGRSGDTNLLILAKGKLGAELTMMQQPESAEVMLRASLEMARANPSSGAAAAILNDLGNLLATGQKYDEALAAFQESGSLAGSAGELGVAAQAACNAAATAVRAGMLAKAEEWNGEALKKIDALPASHQKTFLLLTAGQTDQQILLAGGGNRDRLLLRAQQSFQRAAEAAQSMNDRRAETYALGYLGQLYEQDGQPGQALSLTRRAAFVAQQAQMPEALYRWEWQAARLLGAQGDPDAALASYRRAVQTLQPIRHDIALGYGNAMVHESFRQSLGPLYFELADLLLVRANDEKDPARVQALYREAREIAEQLKSVELEDYFHDDCCDVTRGKIRSIEAVDPHTAVVYLIPLPARTEILVSIGSEIHRFTAGVGVEALTREVRELRRNLETRTTYEYLVQAQQLYDWIIRPMYGLLATNGIDTLVFVPDGSLQTIPLASLHDGNKFLIEEFAVAVTPGLSLMEPRPIPRSNINLLMCGLSDPVQGFPALEYVPDELQDIRPDYQGTTLLNGAFVMPALAEKLTQEQFSIVHIASHGQFNRDSQKTFVLTYDGKLTLNNMEALIRPSQYRGKPVELLVLSACQTAAGDDRAALGLAGVAVKAGARSALASLWFVNDQSTSILVSEVYQQLSQSPGLSKAKAVQAAQIKMLGDRRYRHPCYWAPYLIIGNWL